MKIFLLSVSLLLSANLMSQTIVYEENFESTLSPFFQLNTDDLSGSTGSLTKWTVDDYYLGGPIEIQNYMFPLFPELDTVPDTPNQPSSITNYPMSKYLHMSQQEANTQGVMCASYIWSGDAMNVAVPSMGSTYFARTQGVNAMGMTDVTLSFWWLGGLTPSFGEIYYSLDAGNTWTLVQTGMGDQADWTEETITNPAWDNLTTSIWFGFRYVIADEFSVGGGYLDVETGFSIDDIKVTGISSTSGIDDVEDKKVKIYPNPSSSQITIDSDEQINEILVFDMFGSLVLTESTNSFSVETLSEGVYTLKINTENGFVRSRFVKD
ncbi:MAG: T9SS type A sorting domain-containing protein [Flavobacteriales bacterium]|nr:T9SS type A sorting domain-containing protein [Flavobacteriales bacterium]